MRKFANLESRRLFNIVLYQPEIALNTGNIGRLCVGSGSKLHLIRPMRFMIDDKSIRRSGLDYWEKLHYRLYDDWEDFLSSNSGGRFYLATTKSSRVYSSVTYEENDFLIFGPESRGLPEEILNKYSASTITIPMHPDIRSINLSNSVAIVLYEAGRQRGFEWKSL